jgi:hypothetical protein
MPARRAYQLSGLAALLVAVFLGYQAAGLTYYTRIGPGPGFFPRWLCGVLALLAQVTHEAQPRGPGAGSLDVEVPVGIEDRCARDDVV